MCGIFGIVGNAAEVTDLDPALSLLKHRGPDRQASIRSGKALLGHTRLSIIDTTSGGDQPMQDPSGRYTLVFNGEIYNYRTIASELLEEGLEFKSESDTEVFLQLLIRDGISALQHVNGFFAFAFYDSEKDELLLARDRLGIKPLYFCETQEQLFFSSELAPLDSILPKRDISKPALSEYLRFNYVPAPRCLLEGSELLMPGEYLRYSQGKTHRGQYYEVKIGDAAKAVNSLRELLEDSVRLRLISDVPLGSFLSGGVDSSIIAALAVQENKNLKTFSIGFKDNPLFDESRYAERVAEYIGTDHHSIQLREDDMLEHVEQVLEDIREPFADSSAIAVHALCKYTRKHVTVALSGDGADELFGGYNKHQAHLLAINPNVKSRAASLIAPLLSPLSGSHGSAFGNQIRKIQRFDAGRALNHTDRYFAWASWTSDDTVRSLLNYKSTSEDIRSLHERYAPKEDSIESVLLADTQFVLPNDMLRKVDRMSMAHSLEVRVPFLDHRVVEYAHNMKGEKRLVQGVGKRVLRSHFSDLLPDEIFTRKKKGFEVPLESWFCGPLNSRLEGALTDNTLTDTGCFNPESLKDLAQAVRKKQIGDKVHLLWALFVLQAYLVRK